MEQSFDLLKNIEKVDPNPYLFSKIKEKIENLHTEQTPALWFGLSLFSLCMIIGLQIFIIQTNTPEIHNSILPSQSFLFYE